jgi:hypothetical protein
MALLLIAVTWMLLAGIVVALCRAARLGDDGERSRPERARVAAVAPRPPAVTVTDARPAPGRRRGAVPGRVGSTAFTKSSRRHAGLHRA